MYSVIFCLFTKLCNHHHYIIFISPQRNPAPISSHSTFSPPLQPLETATLLSVPMDLPLPGLS